MRQLITLHLASVLFFAGVITKSAVADEIKITNTVRPAQWASPVALEGVPNLFKVNESLYRSAQPTAEGMTSLARAGIKTVVNLRSFHSDRAPLGSIGLRYEHIFMKAWHPEREEVLAFLRILKNSTTHPVLVHCQHGADRTGTMIALYRVVVDGWSPEDAVKEMVEGGYGFHGVWVNLPRWIRSMDIEALRRELEKSS
jgi:protein tyrosine phosphatase (PTP) superfamily phosphohydrolase (DUF442 family)